MDDNVNSNLECAKKETDSVREKLGDLESKMKEFDGKIEDLNLKDLYLEAYSRRENIKFMNIEEGDGDENVEDVIRTFLRDELNYKDYDKVEMQRIHRNPARKNPNRREPRPILARFLRAKDCESIMSHGRNLKGTNYQMFTDLPTELVKRRKAQMPTFKLAKANRIPAAFSKSEPDKLYIRGKLWPVGQKLNI